MNDLEKFKKYITDVENAAKFLNQHFINKKVTYFTENQEISVVFKKSNFMHLCGIKFKDGAEEFFNAALTSKIDLKKVKINSNGTTFLKLPLLKSINLLLTNKISLTDKVVYLHLTFDKSLRTKKQVFALGLETETGSFYFPKSLLNLNAKQAFPAGKPIISIKSIDLTTQEETIFFDDKMQK